jgi:zinc D-Ala-D-Ala carboxypeptidase
VNLSPHFTLAEFTHSQTAARLGLDNDPPIEIVAALKRTAQGLEAVRVRLGGVPIIISSGYRSPAVNRAVGGSERSQHMRGEAADFTAPRFGTPRQIVDALADSDVPFDQCILEHNAWCHISFSDKPRRQALIIDRTGTRPLYA